MILGLDVEQEQGGRWIAEVLVLPGAMSHGPTQDEAVARAKALALRAMAERLEHGEAGASLPLSAFMAVRSLGRECGHVWRGTRD